MNKIESFFWLLCFSLTLSLLSACASKPSTTSDYDPNYNFSRLKTYAWIAPNGEQLIKTLDSKRQVNAIETVLNRKGYSRVSPPQEADFLLRNHLLVDSKIDIDRFHQTWGYHPYFHPHHYYPFHCGFPCDSQTVIREYKIATMVLDVVDPERRQVVWRGAVSYSLPIYEDKNIAQRESDEIAKAEYMLENFPPSLVTSE